MKVFDQVHCNNLASLSLTKSRYIALLTSMHMIFLYKKEKSARDFLKAQRKLQSKWRHELGLKKHEVDKTYKLLQWCDALSLLLCQGNQQPEQRSIEISPGDKNKKFHLFKINDQQLTVVPWPFKSPSFQIYFETRLISQLQFKSSGEFRQAFLQAPVKEVTWQMKKIKASSLGLKVV